ncbi:MAG: hypothetical protein GYB67_16120 [Chloroflexi bacterium]|nr:hypothetical protein [Chloroflexota bacterium]
MPGPLLTPQNVTFQRLSKAIGPRRAATAPKMIDPPHAQIIPRLLIA